MLKKLIALQLMTCLLLCLCSKKEESSQKVDSTEVAVSDTLNSVASAIDPDPSDSIPATGYEANASDPATAEKIKNALPALLEKQLQGADSTARKFIYYQTDLNGDGIGELFVGFTGMNWCGSGGCTALLLSNDGKLITYFTVADFPFTVLEQKTGGWKDLVVYSGGANRLLQWKGKTYPSNPSVAPKFKEKLGDDAVKPLAYLVKGYPWYTF